MCLKFSSTASLVSVVGQLVVDLHGNPGRGLGQHVVEIVAVDVDDLAVLERLERLLRLADRSAMHADDERQLDLLHGAVGLDVVGDLDPRPAYAIQLVLNARHGNLFS